MVNEASPTQIDFAKGMEEYRNLRERGLDHEPIIFSTEPEITPHETTIELPYNILVKSDDDHPYGSPKSFIAYLREVNAIPREASEEYEQDTNHRFRVRFRWWTVEGWHDDLIPRSQVT